MSEEEATSLADILPDREWITLTEGATALAFGTALDAGGFVAWQIQLHREHSAETEREHLAAAAGSVHDRAEARAAYRHSVHEQFRAALAAIVDAAQGKRFRLMAVPPHGQTKAGIETYDLMDLNPWGPLDTLVSSQSQAEWRGVLISRTGIVDWDQSRKSRAAARAVSSAAEEADCRKALEELMRRSPDLPQPKDRVRGSLFPNLPERAFNRAWTCAAQNADTPAWSGAGRRKRRANHRP